MFINPNLRKKQERQFYITFKQIGNRLFGDVVYIYPPEKPEEGTPYGFSGDIDGRYISFEAAIEMSNGIQKDLFYGEVSDDQIHFIYKPENLRPSEFIAKRVTTPASDAKP